MVVHGKDHNIDSECWASGGPGERARLWGGSRMPYVLVKENFLKWWIKVEGLVHSDVRHLAEKIGEQPEQQSEADKTAEFSIPSWMVLNGLEQLGYKVVSSSQYVTGEDSFDQKEFVWTLHKCKEDWESS